MVQAGFADQDSMVFKKLRFEIVEGDTEGITYSGVRKRRKTVLLRVGSRSISKQALELGVLLSILQLFDAVLTYFGLTLHGIHLEGNGILSRMMHAYGLFPALLLSKLFALFLIALLTIFSHKRKWIRPFIFTLCAIYIALAIVPWTFIISAAHSGSGMQ